MKKKQEEKSIADMSMQEMGFKLLEVITQHRPNELQMEAILTYAMKVLSQPTIPDPDEPSA